jgi:hypothetical protein
MFSSVYQVSQNKESLKRTFRLGAGGKREIPGW